MAKNISILIVDDHESIRQLLKDRLEVEQDMKVVAHADNAEAAVAQAIDLKPDVIVMDIDMPGLSAFDAVGRISARCPNTRVIFLTAYVKDRYIESALAVQAWGYVTKTEPPEAVIKAIRDVSHGFAYFSPAVQSRIVVDSKGMSLADKGQTVTSSLTAREREVLCYLAQGLSKKSIAETMCISVKTVDFHTTHLMDKLSIHDRVELARFAIREGLVDA